MLINKLIFNIIHEQVVHYHFSDDYSESCSTKHGGCDAEPELVGFFFQ